MLQYDAEDLHEAPFQKRRFPRRRGNFRGGYLKMKRMYKLLSVFLCLAMLIGWLPVVAYAADGTYKLVTDASTLAAGDKIVIVAAGYDYALSTTQNSNNRGQAAVTKDTTNNTVSWTEDAGVQVITLEAGTVAGTFALCVGNNAYLSSAAAKSLTTTTASKSANADWKIDVTADGVSTVESNITANNKLQYNSSSPRFSCYTSTQTPISIYKWVENTSEGGGDTGDCTHDNATYNPVDGTNTHKKVCPDCTTVFDPETHTFTKCNSVDDETHTGTCSICGEVSAAPHEWEYVDCKDGKHHTKLCKFCMPDSSIEEEHTLVNGKCECGYVVLSTATLVTDASTLKTGDKIIIVNQDRTFALSATQNTNNRGQAAVTKNADNTVNWKSDAGVQVLTLGEGTTTGTFSFNTGSGYLYAASSSSNYLKTKAMLDDNGSWTILIDKDTGVATVTAQGTYTRNLLKYNSTSSLFSCYASGQQGISIYILPPEFDSASLVLSGEIGVNFYMNIPAYANGGKMVFTVSGKNGKTTEINCSDATVVDGQYKFTCYVNAIQMADTITATYYYGTDNAEMIVQTYSVQQYINAVASSGQPDTVKALAAALANYGHYTQLWLAAENNFTIDGDHAKINSSGELVVEGLDLSGFGCTIADKIDGIDVYGALSLDAKTSIYLYFDVADTYKDGLTVTVDGKNAMVEEIDGQYRVVISGISAHLLGKAYTVVVNGTMTVNVSALSYAHAVLSGTTVSENAKNAMAALYAYYNATVAYQNTLTNQ